MEQRRPQSRLPRKRVVVVLGVVAVALYLAYLPSGGGFGPRSGGSGGGALKTLSALHRRWTEAVAKRPSPPPVEQPDEEEEAGAEEPAPADSGAPLTGDKPGADEPVDEEEAAGDVLTTAGGDEQERVQEPEAAPAPPAEAEQAAEPPEAEPPAAEPPAAEPPAAVVPAPPVVPAAPMLAPPPPSSAGVRVPAGPQAAPASEPRAQPPYPTAKPDPKDVIMTMISANNAARHAVALVQTLRDVDTRADAIVIMVQRGGTGSPECHNYTWKVQQGRPDISCSGPDTIVEELISPVFADALRRLGAVLIVTDEIARTRWTEHISGGRSMSWGLSLNKMQIFNMTQYRKIVFMDADTIVFKNLDHLFGPEYPMFTAALTYACCNQAAAPIPSGGFWIVEPDVKWGIRAWELMVQGKPLFNHDGTPKLGDDGKPTYTDWYLSDLDLARAMFTEFDHSMTHEANWPQVNDKRHGYVPNLRQARDYADLSDDDFKKRVTVRGEVLEEGFLPAKWDGVTAVWRSLDLRYDQCVGMCECLPGRSVGDAQISAHFSCIPIGLHKPGWYTTEENFFDEMYHFALSCSRHYYIEKWIDALHRAGVRLEPPYYTGPPVPIFNATHDELVRGWRGAKLRKQQEELDISVAKRRADEKRKEEEDAKKAGAAGGALPQAP